MKVEAKNKFNKVYYTLEYDKANNYNYSNWIGYVGVEDVKDACLKCLTVMEKNKCANILNDNSQISGPWSGANEWIASVWMPKALQLGLKRFAHVVSPNVFSAMSVEQLVSKVEGMNFEMRIFKTKEEAHNWLRSSFQ